MALVTAAQVRDAGLPQISSTGEDTLLGTLIGQAEEAIARWLCFPKADSGGYRLDTATYTLYVSEPHPFRPDELVLPMRPLVTVTTVHRSESRVYDASTLVSASDYEADLQRGVLVAAFGTVGWYNAYRAQKVVCTAGLGASGSGPGSVITAVALQVAHILTVRRTGPTIINASAGGQSTGLVQPPPGIVAQAQQLLRPYQLTERLVSA